MNGLLLLHYLQTMGRVLENGLGHFGCLASSSRALG